MSADGESSKQRVVRSDVDAEAEQGHTSGSHDGLLDSTSSAKSGDSSAPGGGHDADTGSRLQDRLLAKLLQSIVPSESPSEADMGDERISKYANRAGFSLPLMTNNFRRFNSRVGVLFIIQNRLIRLLVWKKPTHTLSFLSVYTFLCLDPYLMAVVPFAVILLFVMVPSFLARHPPPPTSRSTESYFPYGPPIAPPVVLRPASEISKDFFRNLGELQNTMADFANVYDQIAGLVGPPTNFSDEALSSAIFLILFVTACIAFLVSDILPYRIIFLVVGWALTCFGHPAFQQALLSVHKEHLQPREDRAKNWLARWIEREITLDFTPETREVEIFELQRRSGTGEWEGWLFSPSPYDLLSPERVSNARPSGTRFLDDVQPPPAWTLVQQKWSLDMHSREWVEERLIATVKVETEGERWVYDVSQQERKVNKGNISLSPNGQDKDEEGWGKIDQELWRRRRWVRLVKRRTRKKT
ncbi:MAG: hypothetical protein M1816_001779 [Peltula sp. TS41687]|nr:MAG: hypothetical protein M1816_001779 [Peltula sp. TS41687]